MNTTIESHKGLVKRLLSQLEIDIEQDKAVALCNAFQNSFHMKLSQDEPVGYIEVNQYNEYRLEPADLFDCSKIEKDIKHNIYLAPPSTEALQKDKAELIEYAIKLRHELNYIDNYVIEEYKNEARDALAIPQPKCMQD